MDFNYTYKRQIQIESDKNRYHTEFNKNCIFCNSIFNHGLKTTYMCKCCILFIICNECNEWFQKKDIPKDLENNIKNNRIIELYCSSSCAKIHNGKKTGHENIKSVNEREKYDQEFAKVMYKARSNVGKTYGKQNIKYANDYLNKHPEIRIQNGINVGNWWNEHEDLRLEHNQKAAIQAGKKNKELWETDPEWVKNQIQICRNNLKIHKNFIEKDGILYFYNKLIKDYIPWNDYKIKFKENNNLYIPSNCKCKQCKSIIDPDKEFCSDICKQLYKEDKGKYIKRNNHCNLHPNQIYTYLGECLDCFIEEIKEIPNVCKCKNCGNLIDPYQIFCNDKCKIEYTQNHKSMFKKGNQCKIHPEENLIYGQVCWSCYQENFKENNEFEELNEFLKELKKDYSKAYIQPTYRTQESQDWTGAKSAFEQDLLDHKIEWFAYIKFSIDNSNFCIFPLVSGKSGSLLVNKNGTDVNFSEREEDGPARKLLKEENLQWDKTQIIIIPAESEQEALNIEKEIHDKYGLFSS